MTTTPQERTKQFHSELDKLENLFIMKNLRHNDSYLTIPKTEQEAFGMVKHKFQRLEAILKIPEAERTPDQVESMKDDIRDLAVYDILFGMWHDLGERA